jgi:hypothetical protein
MLDVHTESLAHALVDSGGVAPACIEDSCWRCGRKLLLTQCRVDAPGCGAGRSEGESIQTCPVITDNDLNPLPLSGRCEFVKGEQTSNDGGKYDQSSSHATSCRPPLKKIGNSIEMFNVSGMQSDLHRWWKNSKLQVLKSKSKIPNPKFIKEPKNTVNCIHSTNYE